MLAADQAFLARLQRTDARLGVKYDPLERGGRWFVYRIGVDPKQYKNEKAWKGKTVRQRLAKRNNLFTDAQGRLCKFLWWVEDAEGGFRPLDDRVFAEIRQFDTFQDNFIEKLQES